MRVVEDITSLCRFFATSMMNEESLEVLAELIVDFPPGGIVVEIGAYSGRTWAFIGRMLENCGREEKVLSIDPFDDADDKPNNLKGKKVEWVESIQTYSRSAWRFGMLVGKSQDVYERVVDPISLLIVDGSHTYENAKRDYELYMPKLIPGGMAFLHDYGHQHDGVVKAVDEYFEGKPEYTLTMHLYGVVTVEKSDGLDSAD